jgi:hypothetical protein
MEFGLEHLGCRGFRQGVGEAERDSPTGMRLEVELWLGRSRGVAVAVAV